MDKDIAVIGMACRFPGADNCEKYWDQLKHGFFAIQEIPSSRWVWNEYKENSSFPDEMGVCRWGSFINNVSSFDADFFNISGREAESMDPQQRIMLELAWACFEDAGIPPSCVSGNKVGVYTGVFNYDYKELQERDPAYVVEAHHSTGTAIAAIPNRISYYFNLTGPSLPIDTACASSLHAIHLAAQALNTGECEMALAGGISLLLTPTRHISFSKTGMLSPTGTCRVFDEAADGYLRGEGAGLILLKPLKKAMADGDHIYGIVKGSAANHSGKVRTLTYPNPDAQADVIITAMKMAGTTPDTISYIEAHGTGTPKGDPIEFEGLCKAFDYFRETMPTGQFCGMGSVKANIGHLESAAGIAGVIKVLMAMKYRQLPGQINYKTLNPRIAIDRSPFYIVQDLQEWKSRRNIAGEETPRRAGVSSFGFGGTNTHVILEEPPLVHCPLTEKFQEQVICLSAKTRSALKRKIEELIAWLENHPSASIAELSAALLAGREHFNIRIAFVADGITEVKKKLMTLLLQDMPEPTAVAKIHGEFITADLMRVLEPEEYITQEEYIRLLNRLADEYNKGSQWDKNVLYAMRRRHCSGLPTYPFEKSVYWITTTPPVRELPKEHNTNPLLQQVTTQPGRFTSTFSGEEFFLKDHVVFGRKILPGVAYLEMARAAAEKVLNTKSSASICIENVVWRQPFRMNSVSATLYIDVSSLRADALTYKVYSNSEAGQAVVHGTGTVCIHHIAVPDSYDSSLLQKGVSVKRAACYRLLSDAGLEYGPGHQALEEIFERQGAVTGRIKLPVVLNATRDTYVLHPAILDAALQAAFLMFHKDADKTQVLVPFTLDSLNIYKPCTTDMWAIVSHSKYTSDKKDVYRADIDICDMDGQVCIQMKGVAFRPLQKERDQVSTLILRPDWKQYQEKQELPFVYDHHRVVLCGWERDHGSFVEEALNDVTCTSLFTKASVIDKIFTFYAEMLFVTAKDILTECAGEKIRIQVVISPDLHAVLSGLSGLLMTAAAEHVFFHWQLIDVTEDSLSGVIECLKKNWNTPINQHIRYEGTKRMIRGWEEITTSLPLQKIPWKADGVYLITGGTGGLGQVFAREILTRQPSANLILTGRSAPDSFSGQREYAHIEYRQADVCDAAAVAALMTDIKETYGKLDGILHCAGVIRDNYIIKKSTEELKDILAPKVNGLTVLDQESIGFDLDFFILFSSFAGAFGNVGQADYAMANAFMDAYSDYRNILVNKGLRAGHTLSVNWPLWASGGMQPDRASVRLMRQRYGITSMDTHAGISSLYKVLGAAAHQVAVLDGDATEIKKKLLGTDCVHSSAEHGGNRKDRLAVDVENLTISLKLYAADLLKVAFTLLTDDTPFDEFGFDSILYTAYTEKLNEVFNLRIGPPLLYECNTFRELADYLLSNYLHIAPSESSIIDLPLSVSSNERQDGMIKKIMELVASLLGMSIDSLSPDTDLSEYGFDSLTYTELASYVEEEYNISVTPTLFFRYTDIRKIATYLQHNYPDSLGKKTDSRFISSELQPAAPSKILENAGLSTQSLEDVPQSFKSGMAEGIMESPRQPVNVPVAVIGMAGRFPMADNIDMFWENMVSERDCISETPQERWDWHAYAGSSANSPLRWGGYIDGLWDFDPMFFNISPREATYMDPQQRLLMMYVWKVIEDAGYAPRQLSDTSTALFIGMGSHEHNQLLALSDAKVLSFSTTGTFLCIGPNRISHFFNLHGPSEPVETACSSSLVAIHKAVELLRNGGCNVAIAGGINALQRPETSLSLHKGGMLSEDGRCRAFSADANGYVRSEGIGLIMLKRLDDAERDGDHIYGVIRSSAVNHGGHTHSLTAPNAKGQTALLISAYRQAGIDPRTISYIEAHGTGTKLGDPVEMNALIAAFKELYTDHRIADDVMRHCGVGSVKSNIGHLEWASGIGGVIKVLLQMQNKMLVKSLHAAQVNPFIELQGSPFYIVQQTSAWKALKDVTGNELPRRAGISSFGFGGVNAHLVLEEYVPTVIRSRRSPAKPLAFILSAKSRQQVKNQADQLLRAVKERSYTDEVLPDIAYTLQIGRDVMSVRVGFIADNSAELLEKLQKLASGIDSPDLFYGDTERYTPASP
ncbi:MAG TPA: SDR family NAD(P)-dependent oxidoreductase, partial [Chitinophaga sp.]|uniref:SDR family NAD(P)-dependent oxidoreductase n=1 Tax=Chitinophaga sp. TaxID=1869181 RepID=UPI002C151AF3